MTSSAAETSRGHRRRVGRVLLLGLPVIVVAACASSATEQRAVGPAPAPLSDRWCDPAVASRMIADHRVRGMNDLVSTSSAAIVGTVAGVEPPRWNSADGQCWQVDPRRDLVAPILYRLASIRIEEVLFGSLEFDPSPGQTITVFVNGDGAPSGELVENVQPPLRTGQIDGPVVPGDQLVLLLLFQDLPLRGGTKERVLSINGQYQGNWAVKHGQALNADVRRSVPFEALRLRLSGEGAAGRRPFGPDEDDTRINPLGASPVTISPPAGPAPPPCFGPGC